MNIFLGPGGLYISEKPAVVSTILGSCISVTIYNKRLKIGGICHALLPKNKTPSGGETFRYVDSAISYMLQKFETMGIKKDEMEVKLLGGADVFDHMDGHTKSVGQQNRETALEILKNERLTLSVSDVGGNLGRKIHFYTHTGRVLLKRIKRISEAGR
jgi:chemotaxis protein CheD